MAHIFRLASGEHWCIPKLASFMLGLFLVTSIAIADEKGEAFFTEHVLPLLRENCFECHSHESGDSSGGLMLDTVAAMRLGGTRGSSLGEGEKSWLLRAVTYEESELQMPPEGKLQADQVEILRRWIAMGSPAPKQWQGDLAAMRATDESPTARQSHWAYQPIPQVHNSIDTIVDDLRKAKGLSCSPRANRSTLLKRIYFDLVGLPPTQQQIEEFLADPADEAQAFSRVVDRLLASAHFGERWARHWMDISRYADNKGYVFQEDREYKEAFKYRDWLIRSLNSDMPFDKFVKLQLAADLIPGSEDDIPALGFLTLGRRFLNNQLDIIDDRIDVVSRGLMGMTLACARCHDHKYDPISQKDYYSLAGVFFNVEEPKNAPWPHRLVDRKEKRDAFVLIRGSLANVGEKVPRRFVRFLSKGEPDFPTETSGRVQLAEHIVAPNNPLTSRVLANRIWMHLTGASLVQTPSDLGIRCPPPVQSDLLDHLAFELQKNEWSIKSLIRLIVLSDTYAQQSVEHAEGFAVDPKNEYFWRMNRRRIDFEAMRDTLLYRSNHLDQIVFGTSVKLGDGSSPPRRTVYAYIDRQNLPGLFRNFDMASPDTHSPKRIQTTVPQQGLFMLNSDFVLKLAQQLGKDSQARSQSEEVSRVIDSLFHQILGRSPTSQETHWFLNYLEEPKSDSKEKSDSASPQRWAEIAQVLLASNELFFVD